MAYNNTNLVLTGNPQLDFGAYYWVYTTDDEKSEIEDGGYFNGAHGRVRAGDIMRAVADDGTFMYRFTQAAHPSLVNINYIETL